MIIHEIIEGTSVNGPGLRLCVWVQGCKRDCPGCFNKEACRMTGGKEISVNQIIDLLIKGDYQGLSVSGGEPFYQSQELGILLKKAKLLGYDTLVFTGYKYEELYPVHKNTLKYCDYLIDGPYKKDIPSCCKYAGSGNQRFLHLVDGLISEDLTESTENIEQCEIFIDVEGRIVKTGFFDL